MMSNYLKLCAINALIHSVGFAFLIIINDITIRLYLAWGGEFDSRGIAPGAALRLVLATFFIANLTIIFIPQKQAKIGLAMAFVVVTAFFLLPSHPLRAAFYCATEGLITLCAICCAAWVNNFAFGGRSAK